MQKRRLTTIFIIVFVDLLGFSLILPLLAYYADAYGASAFTASLLVATYAAMQFIGAPILGRLSDRHGRRPVLLVSIFGTFVGFLLLGFAEPIGVWLAETLSAGLGYENPLAIQNQAILGVMFLSRALDGLTGGNISVALAYITDVTDAEKRAKGMGLIGAAFGLGFILGPLVGGLLSQWGYDVPAFAAAAIALINFFAVFIWLPESLSPEKRTGMEATRAGMFSVQALWQAISRPRVGPLLQIRFFYGLAFSTFETMFALHALYRLGLSAETTAYTMAYTGVLVVLVQGLAIGWLTARFREILLTFVAVLLLAVSLFGWGLVSTLPMLLLILIPIALSAGILNTIINSLLSKSVYPEEVGGTMGLSSSLESLTRIIAPVLGGVMLGQLGTWAPGIFGAILMGLVLYLVWNRLINNPDPPLPQRQQNPELVH